MNQRNKVGDTQSIERAAILDLSTSRLTWIQPDSAQTARKVSLTTLSWAPNEDRALVMGVPYDFKARWLYVAGTDGKLSLVDEIRDTLTWMRYPPAGIRGVAAGTRGAGYGTIAHAQIRAIDPRVAGVFQVESRVAVEASEAIAALDGVDVLFVGPADLSHDLGIPGEFDHPTFTAALDRVAAAAKASGKAVGILLRDASEVPAYAARGYTFIGVGSDAGVVATGARGLVAGARAGFGRG